MLTTLPYLPFVPLICNGAGDGLANIGSYRSISVGVGTLIGAAYLPLILGADSIAAAISSSDGIAVYRAGGMAVVRRQSNRTGESFLHSEGLSGGNIRSGIARGSGMAGRLSLNGVILWCDSEQNP